MRRPVLLTALILAFSTFGAPVAYADTYVCDKKHDSRAFNIEYKNDKIHIYSDVTYNFCVNTNIKKAPYVKPLRTFTRYVIDNGKNSLNCNPVTRRYDGVKHNWYFWRPYNGLNFNPAGQHIPCNEKGSNSRSQEFLKSKVPRLYYGPGHGPNKQPRWKVNITLQLNAAEDKYYYHGQDFNP